jgi:hypothetical protein
VWLGLTHPTSARPDSTTTIEAESGTVGGFARIAPCGTCSGGAEVENLGNDARGDLTLTVRRPARESTTDLTIGRTVKVSGAVGTRPLVHALT